MRLLENYILGLVGTHHTLKKIDTSVQISHFFPASSPSLCPPKLAPTLCCPSYPTFDFPLWGGGLRWNTNVARGPQRNKGGPEIGGR